MNAWKPIRKFCQAEEIPRWWGISFVCLYMVSLLAVSSFSIHQVNGQFQRALLHSHEYSVRLLAANLAECEDPAAWQRQLRSFAQSTSCTGLRMVGTDGAALTTFPEPFTSETNETADRKGTNLRVPIPRRAASTAGNGGESDVPSQRYLEVAFADFDLNPLRMPGRPWALGVMLASSLILLGIYHRLRVHLRAASRIADNLVALTPVIEDPSAKSDAVDFDRWRISDSLGHVARAWNALLHLTEEFRQEARRSTASSELQRVLEKTGAGGELADALHVLPDGLLLLTADRCVSYVNRMGLRLLGCPEGTAQAATLSELATSPLGTRIAATVTAASDGGDGFTSQAELLHNEADSSSYRLRLYPVQGLPRSLCRAVVVVADVSQQIRADRSREEFVSQVTHELRTPLTNIRAYTETLSSGMFDDPQVVAECYNVITKETRRLSRLVEDILNVSQLEVGSMQLVHDDVDLRQLLTDGVRDFRGLADERKIDLQISLPAKLPPFRGDRDKLQVVITNLLGNALKYTPPQGEVRVGCQVQGGQLLLTVKDTGIGIDPADHERIFEKFQRGREPEVQQEMGTGIGLTTAREIVYRHGGSIEVMSAKGQGATFIVKLPLPEPERTKGTKGTERVELVAGKGG